MYVNIDGRRLRRGFTTGSCAAAAAAAAAHMLLTGEEIHETAILTPGGREFRTQVFAVEDGRPLYFACAVIKDAGDDPDVTDGARIIARVSVSDRPGVEIAGGEGVGVVTKPGLDQPVGAAAINHVPRQMIAENVGRILREQSEREQSEREQSAAALSKVPAGLRVEIIVPEGRALAERTFNPKLGIVGGISILGTTGTVEPMSDDAVIGTIRAQIRMRRALGETTVVAAPGNYGLSFLKSQYGLDEDVPVLISNYVRDAVEIARGEGVENLLLAGHIGKLVKVAGGIGNTHSRYGDHRMEILWEIAKEALDDDRAREKTREKADALRAELTECVMTDAALEVLDRYGLKEITARRMAERIRGSEKYCQTGEKERSMRK